METTTALYYTFRTISQTLAGAVGLLAAFVLFRFAGINQLLESVGGDVQTGMHNDVGNSVQDWQKISLQLNILWRRGHFVEFRKLYSSVLAGSEVSPQTPQTRQFIEDFELILQTKNRILALLVASLLLTCITVTFSVVVLWITPRLGQSAWSGTIFLVGIGGFVVCLGSYVLVILRALP